MSARADHTMVWAFRARHGSALRLALVVGCGPTAGTIPAVAVVDAAVLAGPPARTAPPEALAAGPDPAVAVVGEALRGVRRGLGLRAGDVPPADPQAAERNRRCDDGEPGHDFLLEG